MSLFRRTAIFLFAGIQGLLAVNCPQNPQPDCCFLQGEPLEGCLCKPAYNTPATIAVKNKWCGCYNAFIDASFIYWHGSEEGLELARSGEASSSVFALPLTGEFLSQPFEYSPGFKVGAGITGNDQWMLYSEYTWIRQSTTLGTSLPPASQFPGFAPVWQIQTWFDQEDAGEPLLGTAIGSSWKLSMDLIDLNLSRPYYQGRNLTIAPFAGLQAAFIRQSLIVDLTVSPLSTGGAANLAPQPVQSVNRSHSWAIGPKAGCNGYCLFPGGFRLQGNAAASILYTRYTTVTHKEYGASLLHDLGPYKNSFTDYDCLRPIAELGLGLGWGTYFSCQNYHIDFSATYDFLIFWQQNMLRRLVDLGNARTGSAPLDLHLHGLTVTARFDF